MKKKVIKQYFQLKKNKEIFFISEEKLLTFNNDIIKKWKIN